jgi:hypothetical protein
VTLTNRRDEHMATTDQSKTDTNAEAAAETRQSNWAIDTGVALAAITAYLYCASTARTGGYLGRLELDADILDRNFHQVLYDGFLQSFTLLLFLVLGLVVLHNIQPAIQGWLQKSQQDARASKGKVASPSLDRFVAVLVTQLVLATLVFIGLITTLAHAEGKGKALAIEALSRIEKHQVLEQQVIRVKIDDNMKTLVFLFCGARNCAGMDADTRDVYYFPQNGHSFRHVAQATRSATPASAAPSASAGMGAP